MAQVSSSQSFVCRVQSFLCALPLESVVETMRPLPTEPLAGAPGFVRGLAIVRGRPIPVVDLGLLLSGREGRPQRFVTVTTGERQVALAVDEVLGVRVIEPIVRRELPPLLRDAARDVVDAVGSLDAELLLVLRSARLLPREVLEAVPENAEARG